MNQPRTMPQDQEAEICLLGGILLNPSETMDLCILSLTPSHFQTRSHQIIYSAFCDMISSGKPIDAMTVTSFLKDSGKLDEVGGSHYLSNLVVQTPTSAHTEFYIKMIIEKYQLRKLIDIGHKVQESAYTNSDPVELISLAESDLFNLANGTISESNEMQAASSEIDDRIKRRLSGEKVVGIQSGIRCFDSPTAGYRKCLNYVFAGAPGGGKTAWAEQSATYAAMRGEAVLFISLEMSADRLLERMSCRLAKVPYWKYINNTLGDSDLQKIQQAKNLICKTPLYILCPTDLTGPKLRSTIRRFKRKYDIQMVVLDYLQKMKSDIQRDPRLIIAEASTCFVDALKESKVAGILISQINREHAKEGRPRLAHLAESSQIEKDADFVGFLWPEVAKDTIDPGQPYPYILSIEKNRDGPSGVDQKILFEGSTMSFLDKTI